MKVNRIMGKEMVKEQKLGLMENHLLGNRRMEEGVTEYNAKKTEPSI